VFPFLLAPCVRMTSPACLPDLVPTAALSSSPASASLRAPPAPIRTTTGRTARSWTTGRRPPGPPVPTRTAGRPAPVGVLRRAEQCGSGGQGRGKGGEGDEFQRAKMEHCIDRRCRRESRKCFPSQLARGSDLVSRPGARAERDDAAPPPRADDARAATPMTVDEALKRYEKYRIAVSDSFPRPDCGLSPRLMQMRANRKVRTAYSQVGVPTLNSFRTFAASTRL